jgi:adenylate cyclase
MAATDPQGDASRSPLRHALHGLAFGLVVAALGMLALASPLGVEIEEGVGLDWLFNARGPVDPPAEAVIIAIDEESTRRLGLPDKLRDWPRDLHAQVVRFLAAAGARVVSFDLTFDSPSPKPESDQGFAAAIGQAGNVLITDALRKETIWLKGADGQPLGSATIEKAYAPIPVLEQAVLGHAPFLLPKGPRVDAYWTFKSTAGDSPTLPVLVISHYAAEGLSDLASLLDDPRRGGSGPAWRSASTGAASVPSGDQAVELRPTVEALRTAVLMLDDDPSRILLQRLAQRRDLALDRKRRVEMLVRVYASGELSYLNYYGPARSIRTVPYFQVLEAARGAERGAPKDALKALFKDKAVFVGLSAADGAADPAHDDYRTVYSERSGRDISGVEIQATAFANAVTGRQVTPAPLGWQLAAVGAWGLLLGIVCRRISPPTALGLVAALVAALTWSVYRQFVDAAVWWPSVIPIGIQVPMALFGGVLVNYLDTRREREAVKRAFGQFLPGAVVEQLARSVGPVTAKNRVVFGACLATDAEKYTSLAEETEPGKLGDLMNAYYADLFVPVERSGGVVIDVVGDAMVAVWAGAKSESDLRIGACESGLAILETLDRAAAEGRTVLPTRLGLHAGEMLIGSFGASRHYEYRAVGDIVNTTSRIQGLNKILGTRLLASAATVQGLDRFGTRPLGSFLLVGKLTPVAIVELLGRDDALDERLRSLCKAFAAGLDAYVQALLGSAIEAFDEALRIRPEDGPSRFYRDRCLRLQGEPAQATWTATIKVDLK